MPTFTKTCPTCKKRFTRHLKPYAVEKNGKPRFCSRVCRQRIPRNAALIRRLYWKDGLTTIQIAKRFRVTFASVAKAMRELGVPTRSPSEAAQKVMAERTPDQRKKNITSAQAWVRGRPGSHLSLCKRAQTVQRLARLSSHEAAVLRLLERRGLHPIPLLAADKYNIDFAFPDRMIGFEVTSGGWHRSARKKLADDTRRVVLEQMGWIIIDLNTQRTPPRKAAEQIMTFLE